MSVYIFGASVLLGRIPVFGGSIAGTVTSKKQLSGDEHFLLPTHRKKKNKLPALEVFGVPCDNCEAKAKQGEGCCLVLGHDPTVEKCCPIRNKKKVLPLETL